MIEKSVRYQYYATFCANLLTIPWGVCIGWASPCIPILASDQSPLPSGKLNDSEISDVISLLCVGGLLGNFAHAYIADKYVDLFKRIVAFWREFFFSKIFLLIDRSMECF